MTKEELIEQVYPFYCDDWVVPDLLLSKKEFSQRARVVGNLWRDEVLNVNLITYNDDYIEYELIRTERLSTTLPSGTVILELKLMDGLSEITCGDEIELSLSLSQLTGKKLMFSFNSDGGFTICNLETINLKLK